MGDFISQLFPDLKNENILVGRFNGATLPKDDSCIITMIHSEKMGTNTELEEVTETGVTKTIITRYFAHFQVDFYGEGGADRAASFCALFFSPEGVRWFRNSNSVLCPITAEELRSPPFIDESINYLERWMVAVKAQVNTQISFEQEFFDDVEIKIKDIH